MSRTRGPTEANPPAEGTVLQASPKREAGAGAERTFAGRYFVPAADIYETGEALYVVMDLPGVDSDGLEVKLEQDVLSVEGHIRLDDYAGLSPVYVEYDIGHFARSFALPRQVDADRIAASLRHGVLTIELAKAPEARARRIPIE